MLGVLLLGGYLYHEERFISDAKASRAGYVLVIADKSGPHQNAFFFYSLAFLSTFRSIFLEFHHG